VTQVAAALVLVTGAVLLARSFSALADVAMGVEPEGVLTFEVHLPDARYPTGEDRHRFHEELEQRERQLAAVDEVGAVSWLPLSGPYHNWGLSWAPDESERESDDTWYGTNIRVFAGDYLDAVGLSVVRGTPPGDVDMEAEPMVWLSETGLELFGDVDPVGQRVWVADAVRRVMGIVEDAPVDARGRLVRTAYVPHAQFADDRNWALIQVVKAHGDLAALREEIRGQLAGMDAALVLYRPKLLDDVVAGARAQDRFATVLMGAFALLALTLSLVGTYGVLAGSVASRRREIGIRMALGADGARVRGMVLRYAAALTVPGILIGLVGALLSTRLLDRILFGVASADAAPYALAAAIFLVVGIASGWLPARRATRIDSVRVLGAE
jgi:putative ABC transport system permease protein